MPQTLLDDDARVRRRHFLGSVGMLAAATVGAATGVAALEPSEALASPLTEFEEKLREVKDEHGNVAIGTKLGAGADNNIALGSGAGIALTEYESAHGEYNNLYGIGAGEHLKSGAKNTLIGTSAGGSMRVGEYNAAIGENTLLLLEAASSPWPYSGRGNFVNNCGVGATALEQLRIGYANTAIGVRSMVGVMEGNGNTATGYDAMESGVGEMQLGAEAKLPTATITLRLPGGGTPTLAQMEEAGFQPGGGTAVFYRWNSGREETVVKYGKLSVNKLTECEKGTGTWAVGATVWPKNNVSENSAYGMYALGSLVSGASNAAYGYSAIWQLRTGTGNTAIGTDAGAALKSGSDNVFIGSGAGATLAGSAESNKLVIGNSTGGPGSNIIEGVMPSTSLLFNAEKLGFFKHAASSQEAVAAKATNAATTEALANSMRAILLAYGLVAE
jgi:hypothetical protein